MRKLVKAGLLVPTILLVALAAAGLGMAAENPDGQGALNDRSLGNRSLSGDRSRTDAAPTVMASEVNSDATTVANSDVSDRGAGRSTASARSTRRGRQAPRQTAVGSDIEEKSWWWWNYGKKGGGDENSDEGSDEDDDENQSPSNP